MRCDGLQLNNSCSVGDEVMAQLAACCGYCGGEVIVVNFHLVMFMLQ